MAECLNRLHVAEQGHFVHTFHAASFLSASEKPLRNSSLSNSKRNFRSTSNSPHQRSQPPVLAHAGANNGPAASLLLSSIRFAARARLRLTSDHIEALTMRQR